MKNVTAMNKHILIISTPLEKDSEHRSFGKTDINGYTNLNTLFINNNREPMKLKITSSMVEKWKAKQQAKKDLKCITGKSLLDPLFNEVVKISIDKAKNDKDPFWVATDSYWAGYARGIRKQRQTLKEKALSAFNIINADDVRELSHELGVSEDKITAAVMEVISKRKNGGMI